MKHTKIYTLIHLYNSHFVHVVRRPEVATKQICFSFQEFAEYLKFRVFTAIPFKPPPSVVHEAWQFLSHLGQSHVKVEYSEIWYDIHVREEYQAEIAQLPELESYA